MNLPSYPEKHILQFSFWIIIIQYHSKPSRQVMKASCLLQRVHFSRDLGFHLIFSWGGSNSLLWSILWWKNTTFSSFLFSKQSHLKFSAGKGSMFTSCPGCLKGGLPEWGLKFQKVGRLFLFIYWWKPHLNSMFSLLNIFKQISRSQMYIVAFWYKSVMSQKY